ncbi:MAG: UDP-N-acetylglucosamine--N-acetylmuramyl-(pentapeptide) pyrophosphoryl-undecaprenol N-acetylglucosamine transferase [Parachlamydiaceae bacterium]
MSFKRILITAGGTGGHLYPAQALAQQLVKKGAPVDILFAAGGLAKNRYFDSQRFPFREIPSSPLLCFNPFQSFRGIKNLMKGIAESLNVIKAYRPDAVVGFGSYYTVPILIAARYRKVPIILHEANSIPGRANQWLSPLAEKVGVHFPFTSSFFKHKGVEVGLPLREGYDLEAISKQEALGYYGLSADKRTLLVCGGSQGARAINHLIKQLMTTFKTLSLQVIHLTGDGIEAAELTQSYASHRIAASVKVFEPQMQFAWRAADAFIGRAGASTIAESLEFEVPGILIPYPYATDHHQERNADFLVETVKSGWKLLETALSPSELGKRIEQLFEDSHHVAFRNAIKSYKKRPGRLNLYELVLDTAKRGR